MSQQLPEAVKKIQFGTNKFYAIIPYAGDNLDLK